MEPYFISYQEWIELQNIKKNKKLSKIESLLVIQNSDEQHIYNTIIKKLINLNIFDLSKISYQLILFLSPYIDCHLKDQLKQDNEIPNSILDIIFSIDNIAHTHTNTQNENIQPLEDKTIGNIFYLILDQLIILELLVKIHIFILYLNLHTNIIQKKNNDSNNSNDSNDSRRKINLPNIIIFKISNLVETLTHKIPKATISLLIMKSITKLGKLKPNYLNNLNNNLIHNLDKEFIDTKKNEINQYVNNINIQLDNFIILIMKCCDSRQTETDTFKFFWNICKNYISHMVITELQVFKIGLDILFIHLIKRYPEFEHKASSINKSILIHLEMELEELNSKLNI